MSMCKSDREHVLLVNFVDFRGMWVDTKVDGVQFGTQARRGAFRTTYGRAIKVTQPTVVYILKHFLHLIVRVLIVMSSPWAMRGHVKSRGLGK